MNFALIALAAAFVRTLFATCRVRFTGIEHVHTATGGQGRGYLLALWHQHAMTGSAAHVHQPVGALVSPSGDGDYLAYLFKRMGVFPIRGSSSRRGKEAREEVRQCLDAGIAIAISVDGPKGPPLACKAGVVDLARTTGAAIVPGVAIADRTWKLKTWDGLLIPKPFSKVLVHHGSPLFVEADTAGEAFEHWQRVVANAINQTLSDAQSHFGTWSEIPSGYPRPKMARGWVDKALNK